ncbi:PEP-CTERM sorting domain-containing protein [Roseofilum casamattae]|uniref:PEP-CTERM sorting domain-containing protein n=1 Tax=Roseofilum casamattae BLCC-M143 TaxID=3022442 RepID=A0ABT7C430_9CYAN|nr:PEP-CTERM sorting domain-containing protein [Roseofilum casamattae]MDJ1185556.1 PEP-CTERM sorting domain-containing protein [Roseofilum casamattae BLCC-M143]
MKQQKTIEWASAIGLLSTVTVTLGAIAPSASAITLTGTQWDGSSTSLTWDEKNAVSGFELIAGSPTTYNTDFANIVQNSQTVGALFGGEPSLELADSGSLGIIELNWSGGSLTNKSGRDLVVYETGGLGAPEAFAVSVSQDGEEFSEYQYQFSDHFSTTYNLFATVLDLSTFGIAEGETIQSIRIRNLTPGDRVAGSDGQGFLGGNYDARTHALGGTFDPASKLDADIIYVVGLHDLIPPEPEPVSTVPEPSASIGLLFLGLAGIGLRLRKA